MSGYNKGQLMAILSRGYEQQLDWYKEMHRIALAQHRLCGEADFAEDVELDKLMGLIKDRQELMMQLDKQGQVLAKIKEEFAALLGVPEIKLSALSTVLGAEGKETLTSEDVGAVEANHRAKAAENLGEILDAVATLLKEINGLDGESQLMMDRKLKAVKVEIDKIQAGKKAKEVYGNAYHQQPDPVFLDKKK
ncbi:MAG: hypothetical protein KGZ96_13535 [Clostridia bacterium]|nr:hypothetical protein [Clostridia bacterium]